MRYIMVTGSREFDNPDMLGLAVFNEVIEGAADVFLAVGDCPTGADKFARDVWDIPEGVTEGTDFHVFTAAWDTHGRAAGPIRNKEMVAFLREQEGEKVCLSFWQTGAGNRGTRNCVALALEAGIEVKRFWN